MQFRHRSRWLPSAKIATSTVRRDVERQLKIDRDFGGGQVVVLSRMRAVVSAQKALADREPGARPALRASLVDLASIAELLADELTTPASVTSARGGTG